MQGDQFSRLPQICHQNPVHSFVKRPRRIVSAPIVIIAIGVRKEIAAQRWKLSGFFLSVYSIEILLQCSETNINIHARFIVNVIE